MFAAFYTEHNRQVQNKGKLRHLSQRSLPAQRSRVLWVNRGKQEAWCFVSQIQKKTLKGQYIQIYIWTDRSQYEVYIICQYYFLLLWDSSNLTEQWKTNMEFEVQSNYCSQPINRIPNKSLCLHNICVCTVYIYYGLYIYIYIQWGKKVFSQPPIVQVLPLKKMRESCNLHHRFT